MKLYGNSLSLCVRSILIGDVSLDNVGGIVSSTMIRNHGEWIRVISSYADGVWSAWDMDQIMVVMTHIKVNNLLIQPRLICPTLCQMPNRELADPIWNTDPVAVFSSVQNWA